MHRRFSSRTGNSSSMSSKDEAITLPEGCSWESEWEIDYAYTQCSPKPDSPQDKDQGGWSYALDFPHFEKHLARGKSNPKRGTRHFVRRRRWTRRHSKPTHVNVSKRTPSNASSAQARTLRWES